MSKTAICLLVCPRRCVKMHGKASFTRQVVLISIDMYKETGLERADAAMVRNGCCMISRVDDMLRYEESIRRVEYHVLYLSRAYILIEMELATAARSCGSSRRGRASSSHHTSSSFERFNPSPSQRLPRAC